LAVKRSPPRTNAICPFVPGTVAPAGSAASTAKHDREERDERGSSAK
jgi:hypothetical protein